MADRQIPDEELITGSIEKDLKRASVEGSKADVDKILNKYETTQVLEIDSKTYYRIPVYERGDPELVIVHSNGTVNVKEFTEFLGNVGDAFMNHISYDQVLDRDVRADIEEEIYTQGGIVYHTTTVENAIDILDSGALETRNETRGLTNRSTGSAVFASELNPDTIYGEVVFEIDVDKMVRNGFKPPAGREKPVEEAIIEESIASKFEIYEYRSELDPDMSRQTVVFYEDIPLEYLSVDCSEAAREEIREKVSGPIPESVEF
jgi:hypothetical protein